MCGIVGSFHPTQPSAAPRRRRADARPHGASRARTAPACGRRANRSCTLGHRRLSIIDLSDAAAQPMSNCAGTVTLTFNGEIYNHAELRKELAGARQVPVEDRSLRHRSAAARLRGVGPRLRQEVLRDVRARHLRRAAIRERRSLHLIRDRVGIKPMYFTRTRGGEWLFASEIRALRRASGRHPRDGSHRLLALPDLHRHAGAADACSAASSSCRPATSLTIDHRGDATARAVLGLRARSRDDAVSRARHQRSRGGRRADAAAEAVDRAPDGVRRAVRRAAVGRRRFVDERRADERADGTAGDDVHHRLRGQRGLQRVPVRAAHQPALQDRSSRDADQSRRRCRSSCRCSCGCRTSRSPTTSASRSTSSPSW